MSSSLSLTPVAPSRGIPSPLEKAMIAVAVLIVRRVASPPAEKRLIPQEIPMPG